MEIKQARNHNVKKSRRIYQDNPVKTDVIVEHITEGLMPGTLDWLTNIQKREDDPRKYEAEVSVQYLVTRAGEIYELISPEYAAWGAVKKSPSARLVKERIMPPNLYGIHIEHEGIHDRTQGRLTAAQYAASLWLHKHLIEELDIPIDRDHIVGHYEIDTVNRTIKDPGREFPWEELMMDLMAWDKARKEQKEMEEKKLDPAQQWAVDNGLAQDRGWTDPLTKHVLVWLLYDFWKKFIKK